MAPIQFGILMIPWQLTDVTGPVDVLSCGSIDYLSLYAQSGALDMATAKKGIDIEWHYIGETMDAITSTANVRILPTHTIDNCPKLDYFLIGGPKPDFLETMSDKLKKFIQDKTEECEAVFTVCTGSLVAAAAGILDGKNATTNHFFVPIAKQIAPSVKWTTEAQWVVDGKLWTAGGACAGMDMFAHWVAKNYSQAVVEHGWAALDYEPRDRHGKLVPLQKGLRVNGA